jgi:predicted NBD/HSP70 family sugar kinase
MPLGELLEKRFRLPVYIDHHPRAMLLGDRWFGVGRGVRNFAAIFTGEVLGGALLLDGHLYRGPHGAGGELGHTFVQIDGEVCRCGRRGCWETIGTLGWLRQRAREAKLPDPDKINSGRLTELAARSEPAADLLERYARNIAYGIANLQQTLAPNIFVLHGDAVAGGERMRAAIEAHVRDLVPEHPGGRPEIKLGDPEDQATLRGAAGLILSQQLQFMV